MKQLQKIKGWKQKFNFAYTNQLLQESIGQNLHTMDKKKLQIWMPLLLSLSMIGGIFIGFKMHDSIPGNDFFYLEKRRTLQEVLDLIQNKYVDKIDTDALTDTAIYSILNHLDPHSVFIPANELEAINEDMQGSFFGVGIEFEIFDDTLNVMSVIKDGPGFKAGVKTGDKFIHANGLKIAGANMSSDSIRSILRGNRGSLLKVEILRADKKVTLSIARDMVSVNSIDAAYMINKEIGYIKLNKFSTQTYREFMIALEDLKKQGLKKLIFDLRGNGGGVLDEAVEIADEFLEGDKLITYTEGLHMPKKEYRCRREGQFEKGSLIVLCDEGSASASEVLMGALQDWERATIIGRTSFGKGLVQEQYDLSDHSAIRLTIARYYTPSGRSIQRSYSKGENAYYEEIAQRYTNGQSTNQDSTKHDSSKVFVTSSGKKVYGGGGINPDYFIPLDTSLFNESTATIFSKGTVSHFAYQYMQRNASLSQQYKSAREFAYSFTLNDPSWKQFEQDAMRDSIKLSKITPIEKTYILNSMKASIARHIWGNSAYFESYNSNDLFIKKALEILGIK